MNPFSLRRQQAAALENAQRLIDNQSRFSGSFYGSFRCLKPELVISQGL
jgi:hypothetical protein